MATPLANVNKPTDLKERDADINRKLQIYGIASAFKQGKLPSNDQIDVALNSFLQSRALSNPSTKLSAEGRELIRDVREAVQESKYLLLSKNQGNLIQDFVWQTRHFDAKSIKTPGAPVNKEAAKQHGDQTLEGLRTLGKLIITNGQFRKLLSDATILFRDMASDAASNAGNLAKPSEAQLAQIDRPAEDNTWHEAPNITKDNWKQQAQGVFKKKKTGDANLAAAGGVTAAGVPVQQAGPSAGVPVQQPGQVAGVPVQQPGQAAAVPVQQPGTMSAVDAQGQQPSGAEVAAEGKEAGKKKSKEYQERLRAYMSKKVPQERRDQTVWRLKKMVVECQQHPDYQRAIAALLDLADQYGDHASKMAKDGSGTVRETRSGLAEAEADLRTLIERFANGTSTEDLWSSINTIYRDADKDPELKEWFRSMNRYVRRCLQEQGYIVDEQSTQDWHRLYDHGNYLLREKYRGHTNRIVDEVKFIGGQFDKDPRNKAYGASMNKLLTHLGNDENGKAAFKPHLVKDLTQVIIPAMLANTRYIPLPRIEYSDHQFDAVIDNVVLESDNFMPNVLDVASENYMRWGRKSIANRGKHTADVMIAGIQLDIPNISYHIRRKQGFPSISDTGIANIFLGGDGFTSRLKISSADKLDTQNLFKVDKADVDLKNLKVKLTKSKFKPVFNLLTPVLIKVLRPVLKKVIEKVIRDQFNELDMKAFRVKKEADRLQAEAKANPKEAPNIYSRYASAFQKEMSDAKKKKEQQAANKKPSGDKKVNIAMTKDNSLFPNIALPGDTSSKASEFKELSRKGDRWESPVFSIGSAGRSTDLPQAPQITRKSRVANGPTAGVANGAQVINGNAGLKDAAVNAAGVNGAGVNSAGVNPTMVNPTVVNPIIVNPSVNPASVSPASVNPTAGVPIGNI